MDTAGNVRNASDEIGKLAAALAKAQGEISGVAKGAENPFFKSKYADLAACWQACHKALSKNEIAVIQMVETVDGKLTLCTRLAHSSGQWMRGHIPLISKNGSNAMQDLGSAITYARRYGLCAAVGLAQEDDDGNSSAPPPPPPDDRKPAPKKKPPAKKPDVAAPTENQATLKRTLKELGVKTKKDSTEAVAFISKDPSMTHTKVFDDPSNDLDALSILGLLQAARNNGTEGEALWKTQTPA